MAKPMHVDLPHSLGKAEAKRRLQHGIGRLTDHVPGGAEVQSRWEGDRMLLTVRAMGQAVDARLDVEERKVACDFTLPALLQLFGSKIEGVLRRKGADLLEDKRS